MLPIKSVTPNKEPFLLVQANMGQPQRSGHTYLTQLYISTPGGVQLEVNMNGIFKIRKGRKRLIKKRKSYRGDTEVILRKLDNGNAVILVRLDLGTTFLIKINHKNNALSFSVTDAGGLSRKVKMRNFCTKFGR